MFFHSALMGKPAFDLRICKLHDASSERMYRVNRALTKQPYPKRRMSTCALVLHTIYLPEYEALSESTNIFNWDKGTV
jgi:hypothetical protein